MKQIRDIDNAEGKCYRISQASKQGNSVWMGVFELMGVFGLMGVFVVRVVFELDRRKEQRREEKSR